MFHFGTPAWNADRPMIFLLSLPPDAIPATTRPEERVRRLAMAPARPFDRAQLAPPAFQREYRPKPAPKRGCWLPPLSTLEYRPSPEAEPACRPQAASLACQP